MVTYTEATEFPYGKHQSIILSDGDQVSGALLSGTGGTVQDVDWIPIQMESNRTYVIEFGTNLTQRGINLINIAGTAIIPTTQSGYDGSAFFWYTPTTSGLYYLEVFNALQGSLYQEGEYQIDVWTEVPNNLLTDQQITFNYSQKTAGTYTGTHDYIEDRDYIYGHFEAGRTYVITMSDAIDLRATFGVLDSQGTYIKPDNSVYSESATKIAFTPQTTGTYFIYESLAKFSGSHRPEAITGDKSYTISIDAEAPDSFATAYSITPNVPLVETVDFIGDVDVFTIDMVAGTSYMLQATAGGFDSIMFIDSSGNRLPTTSNNAWVNRSYHIVTPEQSGTYHVYIEGQRSHCGLSSARQH